MVSESMTESTCPIDCSPCFRRLSPSDLEAIHSADVPIPDNELERLFALREAHILDTNTSDPMFDRFVYLAQRLFNVPIAVVGLMDVSRQFIKAGVGIGGASEVPRDMAFCAYTVLPHASDVLVVEDATKDVRFMNNPMVTGPANLRFYAGAPLVVDNMKIGTICIFDCVPRYDFSYKDRLNMLDLGQAVSTLIKERKFAALSSDKICASMVTDMMHNVRTPLAAIDLATSMIVESPKIEQRRIDEWMVRTIVEQMYQNNPELEGNLDVIDAKVEEMIRLCKANIDKSSNTVISNNPLVVKDLQSAVGQLKVVVESSICLGQLIVEKAEKNSTLGASFSSCNVVKSINNTRQTLVHMEHSANIRWTIDSSGLSLGSKHICSPKAINFILLNSVEQLISRWKTISMNVSFTSTEGGYEYESIHRVLEDIAVSPGGTWKHGLLSIEISLSEEIDDQQRTNAFMPENHLGFYSRDQVLKDCEGSSFHSANKAMKSECLRYFLPCAIFVDFGSRPISPRGVESNTHTTVIDTHTPLQPKNTSVSYDLPERSPSPVSELIPGGYDSSLTPSEKIFMSARRPSMTVGSPRNVLPPLDPAPTIPQSQSLPLSLKDPSLTPRVPAVLKLAIPSIVNVVTATNEKSLRVLLVEDSVSIQKLMSRWLKSRGCTVTIAENGKIGLNYMLSNEYDVCFIDFLMPVMSGPEAMTSFYNWSNESPVVTEGGITDIINSRIETFNRSINKEMLVVGMSANANDGDIDVAFQHGMHFYCPKPAETTMLTAILSMRKGNNFEDTLSLIGSHARGSSDKCSSPTSPEVHQTPPLAKDKERIYSTSQKVSSFPPIDGRKQVENHQGPNGWKLFKRITRPLSRTKSQKPSIRSVADLEE